MKADRKINWRSSRSINTRKITATKITMDPQITPMPGTDTTKDENGVVAINGVIFHFHIKCNGHVGGD
jgi:hypothetical protein